MFMTLTQADRIQFLQQLLLGDMLICEHSISVLLGVLGILKQFRQYFYINRVILNRYPREPRLCVCNTLLKYIGAPKELSKHEMPTDTGLLISFLKRHKSVTKDMIALWVQPTCALHVGHRHTA